VFQSLSREDLTVIVNLMLAEVQKRLAKQQIALELSDDVRGFLIEQGYSDEYGARPLRRAVQTHVDDALADAILAGQLLPGQTAQLSMAEGAIQVTATGTPTPAPQTSRPSGGSEQAHAE